MVEGLAVKAIEHGDAVRSADHSFAVEIKRRRLDLQRRVHDRGEAFRPISSAAREDAHRALAFAHEEPITVVLDFVQPEGSGGGPKGNRRQAGLDEPWGGNYAGRVVPSHGANQYRQRLRFRETLLDQRAFLSEIHEHRFREIAVLAFKCAEIEAGKLRFDLPQHGWHTAFRTGWSI